MLTIDGMQLVLLRTVTGGDNGTTDIYRDAADPSGTLYTVVTAVGERERRIMAAAAEEIKHGRTGGFVAARSERDRLILVFRYHTERRLLTFVGTQCPMEEQKIELCRKLVRECMSMKLPYWMLELSLHGENVNLESDGSVNINIFIDPARAREQADEKICATACARILCQILEGLPPKRLKDCATYWLLYKKCSSDSHTTLVQLYRDIEDGFDEGPKYSPLARIKRYFADHRDTLFRFGKRLAGVLLALLLLLLLQRLFFSKVSLFGLRYTGLQEIGTIRLR